MTDRTLLPRSAVNKADTWNAESVFATLDDWQAATVAIERDIATMQQFQGHLHERAAILVDALATYYQLNERVNTIFFYAMFSKTVDNADSTASAMVGRASAIFSQFSADASFLAPEIIAIGATTIAQWRQETDELRVYSHYFDNLFRQQDHVRSAEVEEILGLTMDTTMTFELVASSLREVEMPYPPAIDSHGNHFDVSGGTVMTLTESADRELRRSAWQSYADTHLAFRQTLSNTLSGAIKRDVFTARARRFTSSLEAALFANNIPMAVFTNLIATFRDHLPTWHRYWAVRRRALGLDVLQPYDIRVPLARQSPVVTFDQAIEWISNGVRPLGDDYAEILRRGCLEERWVDRYPNQGKTSNAFSYGTQSTHPFILTNYENTLNEMSILAHELGHSMHSYHTWQTQPPVYADYSLFVAEVASNFHQALVRDYLFKTHPEPDFQIAMLDEAMINFHRYFFIMPTLAQWELAMHERAERGQSIADDVMSATMADLFAEGYGGEVAEDRDRTGITWAEFGHMYANFYVFQYATGISAANALAQGVLSGDPRKARDYRAFLRAGSSLYPLDALKLAGVDMTSSEPVEAAFAILANMVDRLDQLTK